MCVFVCFFSFYHCVSVACSKLSECYGKINKTKYKNEMFFQFIYCLIVNYIDNEARTNAILLSFFFLKTPILCCLPCVSVIIVLFNRWYVLLVLCWAWASAFRFESKCSCRLDHVVHSYAHTSILSMCVLRVILWVCVCVDWLDALDYIYTHYTVNWIGLVHVWTMYGISQSV